jgi:hypothetical protein
MKPLATVILMLITHCAIAQEIKVYVAPSVEPDGYVAKPYLSLDKKGNHYTLGDEQKTIYFENIDSVVIDEYYSTKLFMIRQQNKWGLISERGDTCLAVEFDHIEKTMWETYLVTKETKKGIYDIPNRIIVPCEQDSIITTATIDIRYLFQRDNLWGIYNSKGALVAPNEYDQINDKFITELRKNNQNYYLKNNEIIPFDSIDQRKTFSKETEDIFSPNRTYYHIKKDGKWGIANGNFSFIIPPEFQDIIYQGYKRDIFLLKQNDKWGIADFNNNILEPIKHDSIFNWDVFIILKDNDIMHFYDLASHKILDEPVFNSINYSNMYFRIHLGEKQTLVDRNMKVLFPMKYDHLYPENENLFVFTEDGKQGLIDSSGKIMIQARYDNLFVSKKGFIVVMQNSKHGIVGFDNTILLPFNYRSINPKDDYIEVTNFETYKVSKLDYNFNCIENCDGFVK